MSKSYKAAAEIEPGSLDEWMTAGAAACPKEKTLRQREKYFGRMKFASISELLQLAESKDFI